MVARLYILILGLFLFSGCAVITAPKVTKIVLLAPFEGQYREVGYNALYATRLALADSGVDNITLLPIDDGGTPETAQLRVQAINQDPSIGLIIALGLDATSAEVQYHLQDTPMLIVGYWHTPPITDNAYMLANPEIPSQIIWQDDLTALSDNASVIGGDILSLLQVSALIDPSSSIEVISSATPPNAEFRERYLNSAQFVPEPTLLAPLTYDAMGIAIASVLSNTAIPEITYQGLHGQFTFADNYWLEAPINRYTYDEISATPINHTIE